jgi:hypothetical protein
MTTKPAEKRWTVMLYMAASKDVQTEQAAIRDIRELERVGSTKDVNVLVQIDRGWPGYAERYYVERGISRLDEPLKGTRNINSGKPEVLREFVEWGRREFPSDYYLLVLWGHSYGLGFGRDHDDALTLPEIAASLDRQCLEVPIPEDRKAVDILGANACAMGYAECAYELQDAADFLLAPEIAMPFAGWPYDRIVTDIVEKPTLKPKELGEKIIERFMASFEEAVESRNVSLTLLDLQRARNIREHLTELTTTLSAALTPAKGRQGIREQIADAFLDTAHGDVRPLIDLFDLCERLAGLEVSDDDREKAAALIDAANDFSNFLRPGGELVVAHRASAELEGIHGLGIFAPAVSGTAKLMRLKSSIKKYEDLRLVTDTGWSNVAFTQLNRLLDPINRSVAEFVNATGATSREDRLGLAQLLVSVHRSFMRLEKALTDSQQQMAGLLNGDAASQRLERQVERSLRGNVTFGQPYLRLAASDGEAAYLRRELKRALTGVESMTAGEEHSSLLHAVEPLAKLEDALANVERTVKRVMTHSSLGLGDPKTDLGDPKTDLGDPKTDLGDPKTDLGDPKTDLGDPKTDLGLFSAPITAASGYTTASDGARAVTALYRQVAWSLQLLENGIAKIESDVRAALSTPTSGAKSPEYVRRTTEQMNQSFRALHELVSNARVTAGSVLSHPEYGLGPTPGRSVGSAIRQQLAIAGGLSSRFLHLL